MKTTTYDSITYTVTSSLTSHSNHVISITGEVTVAVIKEFTISLTSEVASDYSFVNVAAGSVTFTNMTVISTSSYSTNNKPFFSFAYTDLPTFSGSNKFTGLNRRSGNGSVFEFSMLASDLTLTGFTVETCSCTAGHGSVMHVTVTDGKKFVLDRIPFTACSASGLGGSVYAILESDTSATDASTCIFTITNTSAGSYIYIECSDGGNVADNVGFGSPDVWTYDTLTAYAEKCYVEETTPSTHANKMKPPLVYFLFPPSLAGLDTIVVSSQGADLKTCGWSDFPCQSIHTAYDHRSISASTLTVTLTHGSHSSETLSTLFTQPTLVQPSSGASVTKTVSTLGNSQSGVFILSTQSITLTFRSITFAVTALNSPLFYQTTGELKITGISATSPSYPTSVAVSASVVTVSPSSSSTTTLIDGCPFSFFTFSSGNGATLSATLRSSDSLTIRASTYSSCSAKYGGAIYLSLSAQPSTLSISLTDYSSNIASTSGPTVFVDAISSSYLSIDQFSDFISCASQNGGALSATLAPGYLLSISSTTFDTCLTTAYGGALYFNAGTVLSASTLSLSALTFSSCTAGLSGGYIYLFAHSLAALISYPSISSLIPTTYSFSDEIKYYGRIQHLFFSRSSASSLQSICRRKDTVVYISFLPRFGNRVIYV